MAYITLKREPVARPGGGFDVFYWQWDSSARREYQDALTTTSNTGQYAPFELAVGQLVPGASFCDGTTLREIRYAGNGRVTTADVLNAPACASSLTAVTALLTKQLSIITGNDAVVAVAWSPAATGPFLVRFGLLEPGRADVVAYYEERVVTTNGALFPGTAPGTVTTVTGNGRDERGPFRETYTVNEGLGPGRYRVEVTEQSSGATVTRDILIGVEQPGRRVVLAQSSSDANATRLVLLVPANTVLLSVQVPAVTPDTPATDYVPRISVWNPATRAVERPLVGYTSENPGQGVTGDAAAYYMPAGEKVGTVAAGDVCSDGQGGIYTRAPRGNRLLRLENLIVFHPDRPTEFGGLIAEIDVQADPNAPALTFTLKDAFGATVSTNTTGRFDGLTAQQYSVEVSGPEVVALTIPVTIRNRYGLWRYLDFTDQGNGRACRVELWLKDYDDVATTICADGDEPVILEAEGLEGGPLQADLPAAIGSSCTLNLKAQPGELAAIFADDRACRVDVRYGNQLKFRGYVQPLDYEEPLLSGSIDVSLTATCGLAGLQDIDFAGDVGQELRGRRPLLNTLLHALSRTDVSVPSHIYTNRVSLEMTTSEVVETAICSDRLAYVDKDGKPMDARSVLNAIVVAISGQYAALVQRDGSWQIRSLLEAAEPAPGRIYGPAGTLTATAIMGSPASTVRPPTLAAPGELLWVDVEQQIKSRTGWKSLTATADAGFYDNAFRQGDYFNQGFVWNSTGLLPQADWRATAPTGTPSFKLVLAEATGKAGEFSANWPLNTGTVLESEFLPIAAAREGLAMKLTLRAKFYPLRANTLAAAPNGTASLLAEIIAETAAGVLVSTGHVFRYALNGKGTDGMEEQSLTLPFGLLAGLRRPRLRLHSYQVQGFGRSVNGPNGQPVKEHAFFVESIEVQLLPQLATWEGETEFKALGPGGTVTPAGALEVKHLDQPDRAGLFRGVPYAFRNVVTRGVSGPTRTWARPSDLVPASLLASAVLDVLALRGNTSRIVTGRVIHRASPDPAAASVVPELLDALDMPHDVNGVRWGVVSRRWNMKKAQTDITCLEIGEGVFLTPPTYYLPDFARLVESGFKNQGGQSFYNFRITEAGEPRIVE